MTDDGRLVRTSPGCDVPEVWSCGPAHQGAIAHGVLTCGASEDPVIVREDLVYRADECIAL